MVVGCGDVGRWGDSCWDEGGVSVSLSLSMMVLVIKWIILGRWFGLYN